MLQKEWRDLDFKSISVGLLATVLISLLAGSTSAIFLIGLEWVAEQRENQPIWLFSLPVIGLLVVFIYHYGDQTVQEGNKALIKALAGNQTRISWKMSAWVLIGTWLTHLGGGSAGREGTAVQMGGSLADQLTRWLPKHRTFLIQSGIAAGFSSVFGTPLAGMFFAYELTSDRKWYHVLWVAPASYGAHWVCSDLWHVHHSVYPTLSGSLSHWNLSTIAYTAALALLIGAMAQVFKRVSSFLKALPDWVPNPYVRVACGGLGLALAFQSTWSIPFHGLGVEWIQKAFVQPLPWYFGLTKLLLTLLTLSIGFKGGEATPLFFIGAMTGNSLAQWIPMEAPLATGLGFVAQFGSVVAAPWTAMCMGYELFGCIPIHLLGLACWGSYWMAGRKGIYQP